MNRIFFVVLASILIAIGCRNESQNITKPIVAVSIGPQKFFVEKVADTLLHIEVMVPPGSSPETYEPTASQLKLLSKSNVYFSLGLLEFELTMLENIKKQNPGLNIINHSKEVNLLEGGCHDHDHDHAHNHGFDPHVWTSPVEVRKMVKTIQKTLTLQHPEFKEQFEVNANAFLVELDSLDSYIKESLKVRQTDKFFIFHPALSYFARDYGLTQVALEEEGKAPSMSHFKKVVQTAKDQDVVTIFIQREFDVNTAKTAASDLGGKVVVIDPLEIQWLKNMYSITDNLKDALNGR